MSNVDVSTHAQTNKAGRTGEIEIERIMLIDRYGDDLDITLMLAEMNLYGDLTSPFHTGSILVNDNQGLLYGLPLNGEETILISVKSSSFQTDETISKAYKVFSISNILTTAEGATATYELQLLSLAGFISNLVRLKKRYSGNSTELVLNIVDQYIYTPYKDMVKNMPEDVKATTKMFDDFFNYNHQPSINNLSFVASNWTPGYAINWITARALGDTPNETGKESAGYVFTEGLTSLKYSTLEEMYFEGRIRASPFYDNMSVFRFNYAPASMSKDPTKNYRSIISFTPSKYLNHLDAHKAGVIANQLETYDVLTKRYRKQQFDWVEKHKEYARLEDYENRGGIHYPAVGKHTSFFSPEVCRSYDAKTFSVVTHNQLFNDFAGYEPERVAQQRNYQFGIFNQMTFNVTIYGKLDIEQGSVVHFDFPMNQVNPDTGAEYISGYFIVLAVRHKITLADHYTYLEVAKDSTRVQMA